MVEPLGEVLHDLGLLGFEGFLQLTGAVDARVPHWGRGAVLLVLFVLGGRDTERAEVTVAFGAHGRFLSELEFVCTAGTSVRHG